MFITALQTASNKGKLTEFQLFEDAEMAVETRSISPAAFVLLDKTHSLALPSGYKNYSSFAILFLFLNTALEHTKYTLKCAEYGPSAIVSLIDRKDVLEYIKGGISTHVSEPKSLEFGFDLETKQKLVTPEILAFLEFYRSQTRRHLKIRSSVLTGKGENTSFSQIGKDAHTRFVDIIPKSSTTKPLKSGDGVAKKTAKPSKPTASTEKRVIIIIPSAVSSLISLLNIKELLDGKGFVPTQQVQNSDSKPDKIRFKREIKHNNTFRNFEIYDNIDNISRKDWDLVAVVFTLGQEWQFKGWKWEKPVDVFHNTLGFCLKFTDEPAPGMSGSWKVHMYNVHRMKRNLDGSEQFQFWKLVEQHIERKGL